MQVEHGVSTYIAFIDSVHAPLLTLLALFLSYLKASYFYSENGKRTMLLKGFMNMSVSLKQPVGAF